MGITFVVLEDTLPVEGSPGQIVVNVAEIAAIRDTKPMLMMSGTNHPTSIIWLKGSPHSGLVLRVYGSAVEVANKVVQAICDVDG